MKTQLLVITFAAITSVVRAQTAPDFTSIDCNLDSHNLYTELNSGKVIVLNWVMPCSACVPASVTAYNVVQWYMTTNPGRVFHYLLDDDGGTLCPALNSWAMANSVGPNTTMFSDSAIHEADYGGIGMPHVVVVGPDHLIYFNGLNGAADNHSGISTAIDQALLVAGTFENKKNDFHLSAVATMQSVKVNYSLPQTSDVTMDILNLIGQSVGRKTLGRQSAGFHNLEWQNNFNPGIYFLKLSSENKSVTIRFTVTE